MRLWILLSLLTLGASPSATAQETATLSERTMDALVHVVAHEIGHAVLREFDLPILGPEEAIADDFATIYVHMTFPERAMAIVAARADQGLADGAETGAFSEYVDDEHRAGRMICVLYGLYPDRYGDLQNRYGMDEDAAASCRDIGPEVLRSWRRVIDNYRMPDGARVTEVRLTGDDIPLTRFIAGSQLGEDAGVMLRAIDWHSQITLSIEACEGSAGWSRNGRIITICDAYIARFEAQLRP
ncbi:DUF4344 domain-containing metallopeptidase [Gymnodinialimonas sp. 2305UL16-5]|uniref:DUF4344 domain-containing metallopeptidase n=1 Tax=Gymnodinialimonas mytili TaxID=3126503 RepID=UPI0030AB22D8